MSGTKKKNNMASKIENKKNIMDPYDENFKLLKDPPPSPPRNYKICMYKFSVFTGLYLQQQANIRIFL